MKNETKLKLALGLSIVAILASTAVVILWACDALHYSVVTLDTFIGVVVALLAIIVTIVLGWQIYNAIDIRQRIKKIDDIETAQKEQRKMINEDFHRMRHFIAITWAREAEQNKEYAVSAHFYFGSLGDTLTSQKPQNIQGILESLKRVIPKIKEGDKLEKSKYESTQEMNERIHKDKNYVFIHEEYEPLYQQFIEKVIAE